MSVAPATYRLLANAHDVPTVIIERAAVKPEASLKVMESMEGREESFAVHGVFHLRSRGCFEVDAVGPGGVKF